MRATSVALLLLPALLALLLPENVASLEFDMQKQHKCIYEEINANVIVLGDFRAFDKGNPEVELMIDLRVDDPYGGNLYESLARTSGQFVFTTKHAGEYKACFTVRDYQQATITKIKLDWKTGVAATDWNTIAKKEHLDSLTIELRKLEDSIREVYSEMLLLQKKEEEMREISEDTNSRVAWYSVYSLLVVFASGIWQLWFLRRFFRRKKLL